MSKDQGVLAYVARHKDKWRGLPDAYWYQRLVAEVGELGGVLAGDHDHPMSHELRQIASICINWLDEIDSGRAVEWDLNEKASKC